MGLGEEKAGPVTQRLGDAGMSVAGFISEPVGYAVGCPAGRPEGGAAVWAGVRRTHTHTPRCTDHPVTGAGGVRVL